MHCNSLSIVNISTYQIFIYNIYTLISKVLVIKKVLKASSESATGGGDVSVLVSELSNAFFSALSDATLCFKELFAEHYDKPAITALLLGWVQNQITSFVELLSRHVSLVASSSNRRSSGSSSNSSGSSSKW